MLKRSRNAACYLPERRQAGAEKHLIGFAEPIPPPFLRSLPLRLPMPSAASPAYKKIGTISAFLIMIDGILYESALSETVYDGSHIVIVEISQTIFIQTVEITRIHAAVRLHDALQAA